MARPKCFICGEEVRRQLGFNPSALTTQNKQILKSLRSSWTKSLCILLGVTEGRSRTLLRAVPYCLSCHELLSNVDFMITTIARLQGQVNTVRKRVKLLLKHSAKVNSPHQELISQIINQGKGTKLEKEEPNEILPGMSESDHVIGEFGNGVDETKPEIGSEFIIIPNFAEDNDDSNDLFDAGEDDDPTWNPEIENSFNLRKNLTPPSTTSNRPSKQPARMIEKSKGSTCPICDKFLFGEMERRRHMKEFHPPVDDDNSPRCQFCGKRFGSVEELTAHELLHFPSASAGNPFSCVFCEVELTSVFDLKRHVLREHETGFSFKCDQCDQVRTSESKLYHHKKRAHLVGVDQSTMHQCPHCPFQALFPSILKGHVQTHGERSFKCEIDNCSKMYFRRTTLKSHERRVHGRGTRTFPCSLCSRTYLTPSLLKAHQIYHSKVRPFMCEICSSTFKSRRNLVNHIKVHDKDKRSGTNLKLQRPRKARLSDLRLQDTKVPDFSQNPTAASASCPKVQSSTFL